MPGHMNWRKKCPTYYFQSEKAKDIHVLWDCWGQRTFPIVSKKSKKWIIIVSNVFLNFSCTFPILFSNLYNCSNLLDLRNLQEQVKKAICYQTLFWSFTVWINCSSDLKILGILGLQPRSFSQSLEPFFLQ